MKQEKKIKIYVAMSGGVDSSVAAALLKKQGHNITGIFFKPWSPDKWAVFCNWQQDRLDAMRVCAKLGMPFKTWDFSKEYGKKVAEYMIESYRNGITPNPDVMCNKEIKFGLFLKKALAERADYIATGHYIRKFKILNLKFKNLYGLKKGKDKNKDQSYFLWTLAQEQLRYCLFPIGDYTKPEVRKLAKKFGLPNHNKKDSQGVCFVGQLDMKEFLKNYIKPKPGKIILADTNKPIGQHDGAHYYTIGQRHGLDVKDGHGPYFVVGKNMKKNILYVTNTTHNLKFSLSSGIVKDINWIVSQPKLPFNCTVKIRYRSVSMPARVMKDSSSKKLLVKFKKPIRALTPGQSAVFYDNQTILGGGVIENY